MELEKINSEDRLYVIKAGDWFSCLGFDVLDKRASDLSRELGMQWKEDIGTERAFNSYNNLLKIASDKNIKTGWRSKTGLTQQLIGMEGKRVEVITTYGEKRRFYVGRSTGWVPCHIEISRINSHGGPAAEREYKSVRIIQGKERY